MESAVLILYNQLPSLLICTPLKGYAGVVLTAVFSPDGTKLVSGSVDNTIRVLNVNSSEEHHSCLHGLLLLWVPGSYHTFLYSPRNALVLPRGGLELGVSTMLHGKI